MPIKATDLDGGEPDIKGFLGFTGAWYEPAIYGKSLDHWENRATHDEKMEMGITLMLEVPVSYFFAYTSFETGAAITRVGSTTILREVTVLAKRTLWDKVAGFFGKLWGNKRGIGGPVRKGAQKIELLPDLPIKPYLEGAAEQGNKYVADKYAQSHTGTDKYLTPDEMFDGHAHSAYGTFSGKNAEETYQAFIDKGAGASQYEVWNLFSCWCGASEKNLASTLAQKSGKYVTGPTVPITISARTTEITFHGEGTWNIYNPAGKLIKEIPKSEFRTVDDLLELIKKYTK